MLYSGPRSCEDHVLIYCSYSASATVLEDSLVVLDGFMRCWLSIFIRHLRFRVLTAFIFQRCALPDAAVLKNSVTSSPVRRHLLRTEYHGRTLFCAWFLLLSAFDYFWKCAFISKPFTCIFGSERFFLMGSGSP